MDVLIISLLIIGGLILFAVEVFLIPGISVAGIGAAGCILFAIYCAFHAFGAQIGFLTILVSAIGVVGITTWFMKSKTVDRLSLKKTLDYTNNPLEGLNLKIGDKGVTTTRLTLIGNVNFEGNIVEVHSEDGFIDEKTEVVISRIKDTTIYVKTTN